MKNLPLSVYLSSCTSYEEEKNSVREWWNLLLFASSVCRSLLLLLFSCFHSSSLALTFPPRVLLSFFGGSFYFEWRFERSLWLAVIKKTKRENHFRSLENHRNKFELIKLKSFHFSFCCFNCCCHYIGCRWCRARQYIVASLHAKNTSCSVYFMCTYLYSSISFTLHPILFTLFTLPFSACFDVDSFVFDRLYVTPSHWIRGKC